MELKMFEFIESVIREYDLHEATYVYAEGAVRAYFENIIDSNENSVVSLHTRIKSRESLREKLLRNKFYLHFDDPHDALMYLSDIVGITIECRFIRNEAELYRRLFIHFPVSGTGFCRSADNPNIYLNMHMPQPQTQRNGFTIYRIDGYYLFNEQRINFELQIKSLVHRFWSEIEHEVVYKNPDFVVYDRFMKNMLGAVRDNLDVVDRQLEIIYTEISNESRHNRIGMNQESFKLMIATSINELVNRKMKESVGFSTDFRKCSAILAQYIYVRDFLNTDYGRERMLDYLEHLSFLSESEIDFSSELKLEKTYYSPDPFCQILGDYMTMMMNQDFEWHVFFVVLFAIQPGNNLEDFSDFIAVLRTLLIRNGWYRECFTQYEEDEAENARNFFAGALAEALVRADTIEIIHENRLLDVMNVFRSFIERMEHAYPDYESLDGSREELRAQLTHDVIRLFNRN